MNAQMKEKLPVSVVIVAQDEERTIGDVLEAMKPLATELIVVDSGSTDDTVKIAVSHGAKVCHQKWLGYAAQKNFAIGLASCEWILSLDADEVVTQSLCNEIIDVLGNGVPANVAGFKLPRVLFIGGTAVRRGGFYPDAQLRLFRKDKGRFKDRIVHEAMEVDGDVIKLKNDINHFSYETEAEFARAMDKYARLSAQHYLKNRNSLWQRSCINEFLHPGWTFFYRHIIRLGFLDNPLCLRLNILYADYVRKKISYLRLLHSNKELPPTN